jgi:hypothetical protein
MLPIVLEEIIIDYKEQLEIHSKYKKCLDEIEKIHYLIKTKNNDKITQYLISLRFHFDRIVKYRADNTHMLEGFEFNDMSSNYLEYTNKHGTFMCCGNEYYVDYYPDGVYDTGIANLFKVYDYYPYHIDEVYEDFYDF